jgi:hypothetical protein
MRRSRNKTLLGVGRRWSALTVVLVGLIAGSVGVEGAFAAAKPKDPGTCSLSQSATGDLIASGSGWTSSTTYQYEIYSAPQVSVGGGQFATDSFGRLSKDLGSTSFFMNVYPNETTLTFDVYPITGNKADLNTVLGSCSITP